MNILGISCYYHDAAAALVVDGKVVAAAEEERFSRKKHDSGFPKKAIDFCLEQGKIIPGELDYIVFYEKPFRKFHRIILSSVSTYPRSFASFREAMRIWLSQKLWVKQEIDSYLNVDPSKILFCEHHLSHAASAFYPSPFKEAAILTIDGVGEWATASWGIGEGEKITIKQELNYPQSLGLLYSTFTAFLGFEVNEGEWKVMGLSPYGKPVYAKKIWRLVKLLPDGSFALDLSYFSYHYSDKTSYSKKFIRLFGQPIDPKEAHLVTQRSADIAASIQNVTEEILLHMTKKLREATGLNNLCMAGGVALNSVANYRILKESGFKNIYIQPAAGDSGGALGAALYVYYHNLRVLPLTYSHSSLQDARRGRFQNAAVGMVSREQSSFDLVHQGLALGEAPRGIPRSRHPLLKEMYSAYWGKGYSDTEIKDYLIQQTIPFRILTVDQLLDFVATKIKEGKVVGWMQGRFEWGPRALGNRSILADARNPKMKDIINSKVKFREAFRPFAPSVLSEHASKVFDLSAFKPTTSSKGRSGPKAHRPMVEVFGRHNLQHHYPFRFMQYVVPVRKEWRNKVPAITHKDGSARPQVVYQKDNLLYYNLITAFYKKTGVPLVLNTSFNLKGEPIVSSPQDAYSTFSRSGIDVLVLGNFVCEK